MAQLIKSDYKFVEDPFDYIDCQYELYDWLRHPEDYVDKSKKDINYDD